MSQVEAGRTLLLSNVLFSSLLKRGWGGVHCELLSSGSLAPDLADFSYREGGRREERMWARE